MSTLVLLRHGRTTANASGVLAGWSPDVHLDDLGREQAAAVSSRVSDVVRPARLVTSPLVRCRETVAPLEARLGVRADVLDDIGECHYGAWTGRALRELAAEPLWASVQEQPSRVSFPPSPRFAHESLPQMQDRAVAAVTRLDADVERTHGPEALWVAVSHGDVIKSVLAWALGVALDDFQRIVVSPASLSVIRLGASRPYVLKMNDTGTGLADVVTDSMTTGGDATVGGASGAPLHARDAGDDGANRPPRTRA